MALEGESGNQVEDLPMVDSLSVNIKGLLLNHCVGKGDLVIAELL